MAVSRRFKIGALSLALLSSCYAVFSVLTRPSEPEVDPLVEQARSEKRRLNYTRTWEGPLGRGSEARHVGAGAQRWLQYLPPLADLGPDGIRIGTPTGGLWYWVAISLKPADKRAKGIWVIIDTRRPDVEKVTPRRFSMPVAEYREAMAQFDKLADNWPGNSRMNLGPDGCLYERIRDSRITSGIDIASTQYAKMVAAILGPASVHASVDFISTADSPDPSLFPE